MAREVLVVEDEPDIRRLIVLHLERDGFRCRTAANGPDALRAVKAAAPDLVVLDLMLPELDGLEVCRRLRNDASTGACRSSCSPRSPTKSIAWSDSRSAPTTTWGSPSRRRSWWRVARRVCGEDADVDALKEQIFRELLTYMMEDPKTIPRAIRLILISRFLERVADHATNIAEMVVYLVESKMVRHMLA